ncbi:2-isopropylmalate synthase [Stigmatella sp. ncwal1]|uniref:2-isopropylmalate synthase n=1 Tax=Stigmatella ashevillensis TaxID=2995309 RepID=A0ABT5D3F8_9BACT|nr:2-isopropylmalate synthase [Stigmatella ashevillena]MDC0708209.1 2-isopropylmalate synthase [Stigmatella ashevillena]
MSSLALLPSQKPPETREGAARVPPESLIYDWNQVEAPPRPPQPFGLIDETLRDGIQSPSATNPSLEDKLELIELMQAIGVDAVNLGMPCASPRALADVVAMSRHIQARRLTLTPAVAARTVLSDVEKVIDAVQQGGMPLTLYVFIGASSLRQWAEGWSLDFLASASAHTIGFAVREGLEVAFVTEDTSRSSPEILDRLFRTALGQGARRLVLCDTVGHATPAGARALVRWTRQLIASTGCPGQVEWHGHNDRGLGLDNALAALSAGADRLQACGLGVGERVGNTAMDVLLLNLKLLGWYTHDLSRLADYTRKVSEALRIPIPFNHPLSGEDAFRTGTGVHAAALIKALGRGGGRLADHLYSSVPAQEFGREQRIEVGFMSGLSNVRFWLQSRGLPSDEALCQEVLCWAKERDSLPREEEILQVVETHRRRRQSAG